MRRSLYRWFRRAARDLPWRRTRDPYAILVSEFMLQQTTVAAVVPYFERWMRRFPTVAALAAAQEQEVLDLWQGLGYYSRARNLHRAARAVRDEHSGLIPSSLPALLALPGIGEYTAGAVAAFAYDMAVPVVDANIARVLARWHDWRRPVDDAAGRAFVARAAAALLPARGGALHTSAIMELGALVCAPRSPHCDLCPVREGCRASDPGAIPVKRPRPPVEQVSESRAFIFQRGRVWLELSHGPRWKGLWLLPHTGEKNAPPLHVEVFPVTRFRITMHVLPSSRILSGLQGFSLENLPPMPAPHRRAVAAVLRKGHT